MIELSNESNPDEVSVNVISENGEENASITEPKPLESYLDELSKRLESEKLRSSEYEEKLKLVLADFQNQSKKTQADIENGITLKINEFALDFLQIYDDFIRAKKVFSESNINSDGLDSILKNMDSLLQKYHIVPIDALGGIFDPNFHEAISITGDHPDLDDNTITKEIRKGYISHERVIRPTLVEISKKG